MLEQASDLNDFKQKQNQAPAHLNNSMYLSGARINKVSEKWDDYSAAGALRKLSLAKSFSCSERIPTPKSPALLT